MELGFHLRVECYAPNIFREKHHKNVYLGKCEKLCKVHADPNPHHQINTLNIFVFGFHRNGCEK